MKPSGLVTRGRALHKFFVRKYRARDVAPDGLTVLPGRQPYFDGPVGRNIVVQEGNYYLLKCFLNSIPSPPGPPGASNSFLGVSDNAVAPLRTNVGLGGTNKLYKGCWPQGRLIDGEAVIESIATFAAGEASFDWLRGTLCFWDDSGTPPTDDTVADCINLGFAMFDWGGADPTKPAGEAWQLTSRFSVW